MIKLRANASILLSYAISEAMKDKWTGKDFPFQNCITCINFNKEKELCNLCNQHPPAEVIAYGCQEYIDEDEIPF